MIKKQIYPKTERLKCTGDYITITEKLDGSNLVIFKVNNELYAAQKNNIFNVKELEEVKKANVLYKNLFEWLATYKEELQKELCEGSVICGEFLGMGHLKYTVDEFDKRFYMFAKANLDENMELTNIKYDHDLFIYSFKSQTIPNFIGKVPVVGHIPYLPDKECLDKMYEKYTKQVGRNVEGFITIYENTIKKYVRMKRGKLTEHFDWTEV